MSLFYDYPLGMLAIQLTSIKKKKTRARPPTPKHLLDTVNPFFFTCLFPNFKMVKYLKLLILTHYIVTTEPSHVIEPSSPVFSQLRAVWTWDVRVRALGRWCRVVIVKRPGCFTDDLHTSTGLSSGCSSTLTYEERKKLLDRKADATDK